MTKRLKITGCSACVFMLGLDEARGDAWCTAQGLRRGLRRGTKNERRIDDSVDVDTQRPKWCPLPILVEPATEKT